MSTSKVALRHNIPAWLQRLEPNTVQSYSTSLYQFSRWLEAKGCIEDLPEDRDAAIQAGGLYLLQRLPGEANMLVEQWALEMLQPDENGKIPYTRGSVNNKISAVRWAVREAKRLGLVHWTLQARVPKVAKNAQGQTMLKVGRNMVGPDFLQALCILEQARKSSPRDEAIISLILFETLREHEIRQLNYPAMYDPEKGVLTVVRKKRVEPENIHVSDATKDALNRWLKVRGHKKGPLFTRIDVPGLKRIGSTCIFFLCRKFASQCEIQQPVSPHRLRHTAITLGERLAQEMNIGAKARQKRSGHANDRAYGRYLDNLEDEAKRISDAVAEMFNRPTRKP